MIQRSDVTDINYYDLLQVDPEADDDLIRIAYRRMVKRHHPDANPHDPVAAARRFHLIQQAYDLLSDPQARAAYDASLQSRRWLALSPYNDNGEKDVSDLFGAARRTIERLMRMMSDTRTMPLERTKGHEK